MTAEEKNKARFKPRNLLGILSFLLRYPGGVSLAVGLLLINISIELSLPQILGSAITGLKEHVEHGSGFKPFDYVALFLGLALLRACVGIILGPVRNRLVQRTLGDIRGAIYDAIQKLAFTYHDKTNSGELISRSTTDVWRLQDFFYACLFLSIDIGISLIVTMGLIFNTSPLLGWLTLATVFPTIGLIMFFASKLQPQWRQVHDLHGAMTTVIQENIAGVKVVKAFAREDGEIAKFQSKKDAFMETLMKTVNYWASRVPFAQFIFGLSMPLVLWVGGREVIQGHIAIGDLAKVVFYIMAIGHRVGAVGQFTNIVQNASASAERVLEIIREPKSIRGGAKSLPDGKGEIVFDEVSFNYQDGKPSLTDVSFTAKAGQTVAILGPTGSGKSTLIHLLPRFYDVSSGRILMDGLNIKEMRLHELRKNVSIIFQETFLFSATVAENIAYGNPAATADDIERCAKAARAHDFIMGLENGYQTVIGERGVSLSGGQRQRLAIARAFLMNPRILIMDDATASVDAETEHLIQTAMQKLCEGRTTFVIAQRFSTVQHADLILVLKKGRIVDRGRHEDLVQRSGFYREIFEQQIKR